MGYEAIPLRKIDRPQSVYPSWPDSDPPDFYNIQTAITRTLPAYNRKEPLQQIEQAYLNLIPVAEKFIYIENQYFTSKKIARALNKRLRERPDLRAILVSSYDPQGFIEKISMWTGRMQFKSILMEGIDPSQCVMVYPPANTAIPMSINRFVSIPK